MKCPWIAASQRMIGLLSLVVSQLALAESPQAPPTDFGQPASLPRPSDLSTNAFEEHLFRFVNQREYVRLGWLRDKRVRDTGPFVNGKEYGTHPAVRVFYSPEVMQWLVGGRTGIIPDGAVIVKEQFEAPAARHEGLSEDELFEQLRSWTIMVKDSAGSHTGWFWSNPAKGQQVVDYYAYPFEEPYSGVGTYCIRCHGSTTSPSIKKEYTFASLRNVMGFPGEPLLFRVDNSWRAEAEPAKAEDLANEDKLVGVADQPAISHLETASQSAHPRCAASDFPTLCQPELNQTFLEFFPGVATLEREHVLHLPPVTHDTVSRKASPAGDAAVNANSSHAEQAFLTSDQCQSCHAGLAEPFGPTMFLPTTDQKEYGAPGLHISPYGEWRWTPMALSGRDPVFYAQMESELAILKQRYPSEKAEMLSRNMQKTCLGCHGAMGKRQHDIDHGDTPRDMFKLEDVYQKELNPHAAEFEDSKYGGLARDGVSCVVCHRIQPRPQPADDDRSYLEHFLATSITGNFFLGEPGKIYGPFKNEELAPYIMEHSIGFKPEHSDYIKQSQMCGTCHTVNLPIVDWELEDGAEHNDLMHAEANPELRDFHHHVEQATYLEWLNSEFENEFQPDNAKAKSCQDCHMSRGVHDPETGVHIDQLQTQIAVVQDSSYQDAENLASFEDLNIRFRKEGYSRHNFRGLNVFMLEMFNQFDDVLGVRKHDFMTGSKTDIEFAVRDFVRQARSETADIRVETAWDADHLVADVHIDSHVGHRFPSGVGFRRAFIELLVVDTSLPNDSKILWSSGQTNSIGVILDGKGQPLVTEFFDANSNPLQAHQPHHAVITSSDQVQIYETLLHTVGGEFTTSFVHGCTTVKDNRLLPRGWREEGPGPALKGYFLKATHPGPVAATDPKYRDGSGSDSTRYRIQLPSSVNRNALEVRATLYYQSMPPYFLKNIFDSSPEGEATRRLHYICSNLKLDDTVIKDWKLQVVAASSKPPATPKPPASSKRRAEVR